MIEVAQASVTIIPTMKGAQQTITKVTIGLNAFDIWFQKNRYL